jgi:hypothetical protein
LRRIGLPYTQFARATCGSIRLKLGLPGDWGCQAHPFQGVRCIPSLGV